MNVLQILPKLEVGGVERGTIDVARYLVQNGHKAVIISAGGGLVKELDEMGAKHYELPVGKKSPFTVFSTISKVKEIIRKEEIDIVHARSRVPAIIGFFAARALNKPFLTTAHGYYKRHPISRVMSWGKFVIVASNAMAKHMSKNFGVPKERLMLVPRGVDCQRFKFEPPSKKKHKQFTIGMISRITPLKGHDTFIRALAIVHRVIPNMRAVIVGQPPSNKQRYLDDIKLQVRRSGLTRFVEFLGKSYNVESVLDEIDVLVSATKTPEAFGRIIIEAQAKGVPVVATSVGGVVDIIKDGQTGLLCHPEDSKAMAEAIIRLYKDKELREKLAAQARRSIEDNFSLKDMCEKTMDVYQQASKRRDILVIKIGSIGDVILSTPTLKALRDRFKDARIYVLAGLRSKDLLIGCPHIDGLIIFDRDGRDKGIGRFLSFGKRLRSYGFDIIIDLQNNRASHLLSAFSLCPNRYGYGDRKLGFLLNHTVREPKNKKVNVHIQGPVEHQFKTLGLLGISAKGDERLQLWVASKGELWVDEFLRANWAHSTRPLIGISIGASERWLTKKWPEEYFVRLCDELSKRFNTRVVLTGTKDDIDQAMRISSQSKSKPIIAVAKTDLLQLVSLVKRCDGFITPDSAAMHIAAAVNTPFVALFGPTDPLRHVPPNARAVIIKKDLPCSPCYKSKCATGLSCMKKITVDEVIDAVSRLIEIKFNVLTKETQSNPRAQ